MIQSGKKSNRTYNRTSRYNRNIRVLRFYFTFHFIVSVTEISGLPNPAIWIGIDDKRREGDFRYYSDSAPAPIKGGPMGRNQPNGTRSENCLTSFPEDPRGPKRGSKWWNRHPKWWDRPCSDKKLVGLVLFIG